MKKCGSLRRIGCRVCAFDKVVVLAVRVSGYVTLYVIILGTEVTAAGEIIGENGQCTERIGRKHIHIDCNNVETSF